MEERGKALLEEAKLRKHLFENDDGLEKAKFYLDIVDYILEERRALDQLFGLKDMLGRVENDFARGVIDEFAGDIDIQWYLLKVNLDQVRKCLDALGEKNKALGAGEVAK